MSNAERISAEEARQHIERGALLVCAYDDDAKCSKLALRGSMNLEELRAQESVVRDREILFYCT